MGASTFKTTSGFGLTGFDSNTTAAGTISSQSQFASSGLTSFVLVEPAVAGSGYFLWNWGATTDAQATPAGPNGNAIASPAHDTVGANKQTVSELGTDSWSLSITMTQIGGIAGGTTQASGDVLKASGSTILTSTATVDGNSNIVTGITGSTANSLSAYFRNLSLVLNPSNGAETIAITFNLTDTANSQSTTFTEVFSLSQTACYAAGTRIATPLGDVAVETLNIGDLVNTGSGIAKPIKWIGRRAYTAAQVAANAHIRPVLIRAGALSANIPARDLAVSPMHALFIDDVFIPAAALVNGASILRVAAAKPVEFVHLELADHDVIFAEGALAETFVDDNSRLMFDNADEYYDMYGADEAVRGFSAPRIEEGYQLDAMRRSLAKHAGAAATSVQLSQFRGHVEHLVDGAVHGWVFDEANPESPVELDVLAEGEFITRVLANRYRADLDHAGLAGGRCAFSVALPASVTALHQIEVRHAANGAALSQPQVAALVN